MGGWSAFSSRPTPRSMARMGLFTYISGVVKSFISTVVHLVIIAVVVSPYLSAGFFLNGKVPEYKQIHPAVTNEIDKNHAAVYQSLNAMMPAWVTLTSFTLILSTAISVVNFVFAVLCVLFGLELLRLVQLLILIPIMIPLMLS